MNNKNQFFLILYLKTKKNIRAVDLFELVDIRIAGLIHWSEINNVEYLIKTFFLIIFEIDLLAHNMWITDQILI